MKSMDRVSAAAHGPSLESNGNIATYGVSNVAERHVLPYMDPRCRSGRPNTSTEASKSCSQVDARQCGLHDDKL